MVVLSVASYKVHVIICFIPQIFHYFKHHLYLHLFDNALAFCQCYKIKLIKQRVSEHSFL